MGMFDELNELGDLTEDIDNPDAMPSGTYPAIATAVKIGPTKNGDKNGVLVEVTIDKERIDDEDQERFAGRKLTAWQQIPNKDIAVAAREGDVQASRTMFYFRQFMTNLGFTPKDLGNLSEELFENIQGQEVLVTVRAPKGDGFPQVTSVVIDAPDEGIDAEDDLGGIDL